MNVPKSLIQRCGVVMASGENLFWITFAFWIADVILWWCGCDAGDPLTEVVVSTAEKFKCPEEFRLRCDPIAERIRDFRVTRTAALSC